MPKNLEHLDFYKSITKQEIKIREEKYLRFLQEQNSIRLYSSFDNWYPKMAKIECVQNIAPYDRANLFREYCGNLKMQDTVK